MKDVPMPGLFGRAVGWMNQQPYLLLSLTSLFWAGNIVIGRFAAAHVPPVALTWFRWALAFLILLPFSAPHLKRDWPVIRRHVGLMTVFALTGNAAYHVMAYYGLHFTEAINVLLLQSVAPLQVALWSLVLFGDRLSSGQTLGILTSLTGVIVILCRGNIDFLFSIGFNRGDVWVVIALVFYSLYTALLRNRPPIHALSFIAVTMGWGTLLLTPLLVFEMANGQWIRFDTATVLTLAYVCVFPSLLGYMFLNRGIELIGANRSAPFLHLVPVFGSVLAIVFLG